MSFEFKFDKGDKCLVVGYVDFISEGEIVKIQQVDYHDKELPYRVCRAGQNSCGEWVQQSSLQLLHNNIKKL